MYTVTPNALWSFSPPVSRLETEEASESNHDNYDDDNRGQMSVDCLVRGMMACTRNFTGEDLKVCIHSMLSSSDLLPSASSKHQSTEARHQGARHACAPEKTGTHATTGSDEEKPSDDLVH